MFHLRWLWRNMDKPYRRRFIIGLIISAVTSSLIVVAPLITRELTDEVLIKGNVTRLPYFLTTIAVIQVLRLTFRYVMAIFLEKAAMNTVSNLRNHLYKVLQYQESAFFDHYRTGDLMTRFTADLDWCRHCLSFLIMQTIDCICIFVATLALFFAVSWKLAALLFIVTPTLLIITKVYSKKVHGLFANMREKLSNLNTTAQENIAGNKVVKAFARENYEIEKFDKNNVAFKDANLEINKTWLKFFPIIEMMANLLTIISVFGGALLIMANEITPGELTIFTSLTWALAHPMRNLGNLLNDFQRFFSSAGKVIEIYYSQPLIKDRPDVLSRTDVTGDIAFEKVTFCHGDNKVLDDISFKIESGKTLAIMGPTGSGKTTILNLIARFYDVNSGSVKVDDCDVKFWRLNDLRGHVGIATQEVFLFSDTVEGNIAFGDADLTMEEIEGYAKIAAANKFIEKLPEGYDTIIGERGVGLSGGQRQRVALARAVAVKPSILMLDDTTSAVDLETEKYIQDQFDTLPFKCTKIIVGQRISSVKKADLILVIQDGKISQRGTHDQLIKQPGYYYDTYAIQNDIPLEERLAVTGGEA